MQMTETQNFTTAQLRSIIERVERLHEERDELSNDIRDVYAEAKANGFDVKAIKEIVKLRGRDRSEIAEENAILRTYLAALGMSFDMLPIDANPEPANGDALDENRWSEQPVAA